MAPTIDAATPRLVDPQLKAIGKRVLDTVRLAGEKAVASAVDPDRYPLPEDPNSFEQLLRARYDGRPEPVRLAARAKIMASLKATPAKRERLLGPLAQLDLSSAIPIERLAASVDGLPELTRPLAITPPTPAAAKAGPSSRTVTLRLLRVVCVDETNGLWGSEWGSDDIVLGATTVNPVGATGSVKPFGVGDFDDGDDKSYSPPKPLTTFSVREGDGFPQTYHVALVLAEEDMGGTAEFLDKLADKLEAAIRKELAKAGAEHGLEGVVIAAILTWVVGKVFDWFGEVWGDEIFKPRTVRATLRPRNSTWNGKFQSPERVVEFKGHGGTYHAHYDWTIGH